jgi:hypothetical protein
MPTGAGYERRAWQFKPLVLSHEMLARRGHEWRKP